MNRDDSLDTHQPGLEQATRDAARGKQGPPEVQGSPSASARSTGHRELAVTAVAGYRRQAVRGRAKAFARTVRSTSGLTGLLT